MSSLLPSLYLGGDRPRARRVDPVTSHEAADGSASRAVSQQEVVSILSQFGALADHEIAAKHELRRWPSPVLTGQRLRTARAELVADGVVAVLEGESRVTPSGRKCRVWRLVKGAC